MSGNFNLVTIGDVKNINTANIAGSGRPRSYASYVFRPAATWKLPKGQAIAADVEMFFEEYTDDKTLHFFW